MQPLEGESKMKKTWLLLAIAIVLALSGCAGGIKGVSNSNLFGKLPPSGTFAIQLVDGDPLIGKKIERMIAHQVSKNGYKPTETNPDLLVSYAFDVSSAGSTSSAYTAISNAPQRSFVYGNTVYTKASQSSASTYVDTTRLYQKTIVVRISDAKTGEKLWEANVSEQGWCNQIFVTAPSILSLMFEGFPEEQTNVNKMVTHADDGAKALINLFPANTNWGCTRT